MNRDGIGRWQYRNSPRMLFAPISQSWYSKSKHLCLGISWGHKQLEATSFCTMHNSYDFLAPKKAQKSITKTPDTARLCLDTLFTMCFPFFLVHLWCLFVYIWQPQGIEEWGSILFFHEMQYNEVLGANYFWICLIWIGWFCSELTW